MYNMDKDIFHYTDIIMKLDKAVSEESVSDWWHLSLLNTVSAPSVWEQIIKLKGKVKFTLQGF